MKAPVKQITAFERITNIAKTIGVAPENILMMCCTEPRSEFVHHIGKIIEGLTYSERPMTICIVFNVPDEDDFSIVEQFKTTLILTLESVASTSVSLQGSNIVCISILNLRSRRMVRYERSIRDHEDDRIAKGIGFESRSRRHNRTDHHNGYLLKVTKPLNGFDLSLSIPIPDDGLMDIFNLVNTLNSLKAHVPCDRDDDAEPFLLTVERLNPEKPDEEISIDVH